MISEFVYRELTTTRKLNSSGDKFPIWKTKIDFILSDIEVSYVLQQPKPDSPPDSEEHKKWIMDDFTCRHAILGTLEDDLIVVFDHGYDTAKEIMDALVRLYGGKSIGRSMYLFEQIKNIKIGENDNVMDHVMKMCGVAIELERFGMNLPQEMRVVFMMDSLPESWREAKDMFMKTVEDDESQSKLTVDSFLQFVKNHVELKKYFESRKNNGGGGGGGGEVIEGGGESSPNNKKPRNRRRGNNNAET
ncbi:hypothetical protein MKW98_019323 [Papaver atlanticum]|uniref:Gag protein n=1 Tax=Papaver atlanticum TaxID=357466 RepID=A0AAD4S909_9MAGN|nr:hypothetical protein MKW98_019323 [Papaver atlanticum]